MVSDRFPPSVLGGYERRCAATAEALAREHDVCVLTTGPGETHVTQGGVQVQRSLPLADCRGIRGAVATPPVSGTAARVARRAVQSFRPDIVYIWNGASLPQAAIRAIELERVPVALSIAEHWYSVMYKSDHFMRYLLPCESASPLFRTWRSGMQELNKRSRNLGLELHSQTPVAVCWNSEALRGVSQPPDCHRVILERVIHPASQSEAVFRSVQRPRVCQTRTLVYVGRLAPEKGVDLAIDAVAVLRRGRNSDTRLRVFGSGPPDYERHLRRHIESRGVQDAVSLEGAASHEQIAAAYRDAAAIVVPSRWDEPFGLVCVEAALAGVPILASRSGGIVEIVSHGRDALLFEKGDGDGLVTAMEETFADPAGAARRASSARTRMEAFSFEAYCTAQGAFVVDAHRRLVG